MSVPTPGPADLVQYDPQIWVDVPEGTTAPVDAIREDAAAFNRMESGITRGHKVAIAAWALMLALRDTVDTLPTDTDLAGYATVSALTSAVSNLQAAVNGRTTAAQVDARVQQVIGAAPAALDTLVEIAAQLANDESAAAALTGRVTAAESGVASNATAIAGKYAKPAGGIPLSDLAAAVVSYFTTPAQVDARVQQIVGAAPAALDTLAEIATQLTNDESAATALTGRVTTAESAISTNASGISANAAAILLRYLKPSGGIPASDLAPAVLADYLKTADANAAYGQRWKANTTYAQGDYVLSPEGRVVQAKAAFTSGTTYNSANWNIVSDAYYAQLTDARLTDQRTPTDGSVTDAKVASGAAIAQAKIAGLTTSLAAKADLVGGLVPTSQIPALALTTAVAVASRSAMLALTSSQVQPGDVAVVAADPGKGSYVLLGADPSQLSSWLLLNAPTDVVSSVNGQTGTVVLAPADLGAQPAGSYATLVAGKVPAAQIPTQRTATWSSVATRPNALGQGVQSPNGGLSCTYKSQHTITADCSDLRLVFGNFQYGGAGAVEADGANAITVVAAIERVSGATRRTFSFPNGARAATIGPACTATTEPIGLSFKKGDTIWLWTNVSIASGTWPIGLMLNAAQAAAAGSPYPTVAATEGSNFSANNGDVTLSGTVASQGIYAYSPVAILGRTATPQPTVGVIGDSIPAGTGDTGTFDWGYVVAPLANASIGYLNMTHKGESASQVVTVDNVYRRSRMLEYCTHAIFSYGTNDLAAQRSFATVSADLATLWRAQAVRGTPVYQTTVTPRTTSTDSWATLANQTIVAGCGQPRTDLNAWLRAGAPVNTSGVPVAIGTSGALTAAVYGPTGALVQAASGTGHPLTGVFDGAASVEDGTSGLWKVSTVMTADGVHPNVAGHLVMRPSIATGVFAV